MKVNVNFFLLIFAITCLGIVVIDDMVNPLETGEAVVQYSERMIGHVVSVDDETYIFANNGDKYKVDNSLSLFNLNKVSTQLEKEGKMLVVYRITNDEQITIEDYALSGVMEDGNRYVRFQEQFNNIAYIPYLSGVLKSVW